MTIAIVVGAGCGLLGYAVGTRAAEPEPREAKPVPAPKPETKAKVARTVGGLVCAARQRPIADEGEDCDALELRARWCETELAEARRERTAVRQDWPDEDSVESADQWPDAVEQALPSATSGPSSSSSTAPSTRVPRRCVRRRRHRPRKRSRPR